MPQGVWVRVPLSALLFDAGLQSYGWRLFFQPFNLAGSSWLPVLNITLDKNDEQLTVLLTVNLTEADYCYLLDPWWNPATENQAVDRTHRIGQSKKVMVYRMVAENTIEEKVMELKQRKADLFAAVLDDERAFSSAITASDIRTLLSP